MTTLTASSTLTIRGTSGDWQASACFERPAEAMAFAARFPKSAGLTVHGANALSRATLTSNGVNGGVNETGIRRYRALVARAAKLGVSIEWRTTGPGFRPIPMSRDEFEAAFITSGEE